MARKQTMNSNEEYIGVFHVCIPDFITWEPASQPAIPRIIRENPRMLM